MQVRGDMVDAEGPMGPDQKTWGGWWSVLLTLGSDHPKVRGFLTDRFSGVPSEGALEHKTIVAL